MSQTCDVIISDSHVPWFQAGAESALTVYGRGYAFVNGVFLSGQALVDELQARCRQDNMEDSIAVAKRIIAALDGCWAFIMRAGDGTVLAAVDRSRSIPLFYAWTPAGYIVADTANAIVGRYVRREIDIVCAAEFLLSGYVSGSETIYEGVYQVQPGEFVEFTTRGINPTHEPQRYFSYFPKDQLATSSWDELEKELERILEIIFAKLAAALKDKRIILPLSGGYDSRLIAWMLKKYGVENVLCYTYGVAANPQRIIAERVAKTLGFEWRFIEYDAQRWADCVKSREMADYWEYAFRGTSSPVFTNFPVVMELAGEFCPSNVPVFLPGHVGDAWAYDWNCECALQMLDDEYLYPPSEYHSSYCSVLGLRVVSAIIYRHLNLWPLAPSMWVVEPWISVAHKIQDEIRGYENPRESDIWQFIEWILRSRTSLWIVNSCRCFEYFGASFMLPLGTNELIDFFRRLPLEFILNEGLYAATLRNRIFGEANRLLHDIPVMSGVDSFRTHGVKRAMVQLLSTIGLFKPLDQLRRRYREPINLYAESWFAQGRRPERMSIADGLSPFQIEQYLPTDLVQVIQPFFHRPLYSIQCNGLLTAVILAKEYAKSETVACGF